MIDTTDPLFAAVRAVATACDGAEKKDGQGFNSYDQDFGHDLAITDPATWSPRKRRSAWKMMRKYRTQLQARGIDFAAIPEPPDVLTGVGLGGPPPQPGQVLPGSFPPVRRVVIRSDGKFGVIFREADQGKWVQIKEDIKAIAGAQFEGATKSWTLPRTPLILEEFLPFLKRHGFVATPEIHAEVQALQARVEDTKANVEASRAVDAEINVPGLGGELRPFQKAGVAYCLKNLGYVFKEEDHAERGLSKDTKSIDGGGGEPSEGTSPRGSDEGNSHHQGEREGPGMEEQGVGGHTSGHETAGCSGEAHVGTPEGKESFQGRERTTSDPIHSDGQRDPGTDGISEGIHHHHQVPRDGVETSNALQSGLCQESGSLGDRDRRIKASSALPARSGSKEKRSPGGTWVERDPVSRSGGILIADEPGLGKTIQALAVIQACRAFPAVVVVPATLKTNWYRESCRWIPGKRITIWDSKGGWPADIIVINYDVLHKHVERLKELKPRALILDETHLVKSRKARRSKAAHDLALACPIKLALTGTPILNRPNELVTQLEILGRIDEFGGYWQFVRRYCAAFNGSFGVNTAGASNLEELNHRLRATCFIRRRKGEVLTELPAKQRSMVPLSISNREEYTRAETDLIEWIRETALRSAPVDLLSTEAEREAHADAAANRARAAEQLVRIEALKKLAARGKMDGVTAWIEDFLESGEKLVVFAHHVDIVQEIGRRFNSPTITGQTDLQVRQSVVDRFQQDPECKLIACNIQAGGVGLTLTAASNVAFVELAWNPGQMEQAEDRTHRIGQKDQVTAWYLLAEKTIDEQIMELIEEKRKVVVAATDGETGFEKGNIMGDLIQKLKEGR